MSTKRNSQAAMPGSSRYRVYSTCTRWIRVIRSVIGVFFNVVDKFRRSPRGCFNTFIVTLISCPGSLRSVHVQNGTRKLFHFFYVYYFFAVADRVVFRLGNVSDCTVGIFTIGLNNDSNMILQ